MPGPRRNNLICWRRTKLSYILIAIIACDSEYFQTSSQGTLTRFGVRSGWRWGGGVVGHLEQG